MRAARFQKIATRLLTKYDERTGDTVIKLKRTAAPVYNEVTAQMDFEDAQEIPVVGITSKYDKKLIDNTTIMHGDIELNLTVGVEPLEGDKVLIDGDEYSIIDIDLGRYTNTDICYSLQLRK